MIITNFSKKLKGLNGSIMSEKGNFDFLYNPIKEKMQELVSHINYTTYIEKLVPVDVDGRFIVLETPTESFAKYITGTLAEKMREAIIKADVGLTDFRLKVEGSDSFAYNAPDNEKYSLCTAAPILSEGDVLGCVLFAGTADKLASGEVEYKLVQSIAGFLGRHMES